MANNEASFKAEFKRDLRHFYGKDLFMWSHTDWGQSGLPDMAIHENSVYLPIEVKFVMQPPARDASKVLKRELTVSQAEHLDHTNKTGGCAHVLVGFPDIAVLVPFVFWPLGELNVTYGFIKKLVEDHPALAFKKTKGQWNLNGFLVTARAWRVTNHG
jgi:hypothetical protein